MGQNNNTKVTPSLARTLLLNELPENASTAHDLDAEIRALARIGRYMVDRWSAEADAIKNSPSGRLDTKAKADADNCSMLHFGTLNKEADDRLAAFLVRHANIVHVDLIESREAGFTQRLSQAVGNHVDRPKTGLPKWLDFLLMEGLKGLVAATGVILVGVALTFLSPRYREEAYKFFTTLLEEPQSKPGVGDVGKPRG